MLDVNSIPQLFAPVPGRPHVHRRGAVAARHRHRRRAAATRCPFARRSRGWRRRASGRGSIGSVLVVLSIAANGGPGGGNSRFVGLFLVGHIVLAARSRRRGRLAGHDAAHHQGPGHEHAPSAAVQLVGSRHVARSAARAARGDRRARSTPTSTTATVVSPSVATRGSTTGSASGSPSRPPSSTPSRCSASRPR